MSKRLEYMAYVFVFLLTVLSMSVLVFEVQVAHWIVSLIIFWYAILALMIVQLKQKLEESEET